jgi:hypothetical protein
MFLGALITAPIVFATWYTNIWNTAYIAIKDTRVLDNTGSLYKVLRVVDNDTTLFDEQGYKAYSPAYLSAGVAIIYGSFFALYTAIVTHTILHHRREIIAGFRNLISRKSACADSKDVHTRLMRSYREVPEFMYFGVLVASIALGAAGVGAFPTQTSPAVVLYGGMYRSFQVDILLLTEPYSFPRCDFLHPLRYHPIHHKRRDALERYCRAVRWSLVPW